MHLQLKNERLPIHPMETFGDYIQTLGQQTVSELTMISPVWQPILLQWHRIKSDAKTIWQCSLRGSMDYWSEGDRESEQFAGNALSEVYETQVSVKSLKQRTAHGVTLSLVDIVYWRLEEDNRRVKETVVFLNEETLDLPKFELRPRQMGLIGSLVGAMGLDQPDITFADSVFSKKYTLHSWVEPATRIVFTPEVREHFSQNSGWQVRGSGTFLVVNNPYVGEESFVSESLKILGLLQVGEQVLGQHTGVARAATRESIVVQAQKMGVVGSLIANQMSQSSIGESELKAFKKLSIPRQIPAALRRQALGINLLLFWLVFLFFGIIGLCGSMFIPDTVPRITVMAAGTFFGLIGLVGTVWTLTSRRRIVQSLREGCLVTGKVVAIKSTGSTVGHNSFFNVTVGYQRDGLDELFEILTSSSKVSKARRLLTSKEPVSLLVGEKSVTCLELLYLWQ